MLLRLFRTSLVSCARPSEGTEGFLRSIAMSRPPLGTLQADITSGARFRQGVCPRCRFAQLWAVRSALFNKLNVQGDCHCVAHEQAAGFQGCVPGEAKVFPADPRRGRKPNSRISPRVLLRWARSFNIKNHVSGHSANRQVAADLQLSICVL